MKTKLLLLSLFMTGMASAQTISLELFADGFDRPAEIANAGDSRLFLVEQTGRIQILNADGTTNETPFLNLSTLISTGNEQGLLGLAFHPDYVTNGYFYVDYTDGNGDTVIARYTKSTTDANAADPNSALVMLTVEQPFDNHNGGCLRFGPDGYLYIAMGDGGSGGDPGNRAQNKNELLGKILRLDVNAAAPYIPATNPYVGIDGADAVWALGLRNPWKFSFNDGNIWIADVGQENIEEINRMSATASGINYGWKCFEGTDVYSTDNCSLVEMYTMPVAQYEHEGTSRCSITGGYVYTGSAYPNMQGKYFFADYCTAEIGVVDGSTLSWVGNFSGTITTFGVDANQELYAAGSGTVYKVIDTTAGLNDFDNKLFSLYPNPAGNEVFVSAKEGFGEGLASIFNVSGQLVIEQKLGEGQTKIDTSKLQTGLYMVKLQTPTVGYNTKLVIN
ncbi:PQQ-dependent sugar dehydrogenase [Flavobacterium hauense]